MNSNTSKKKTAKQLSIQRWKKEHPEQVRKYAREYARRRRKLHLKKIRIYQKSYHSQWIESNRDTWNDYQCLWRSSQNGFYGNIKNIHKKLESELHTTLPKDLFSKLIKNNHPYVSIIQSHSNKNIKILSKLSLAKLAKFKTLKSHIKIICIQ
jgi:hypothetical protein